MIDMDALKSVTKGDPKAKVLVTKAWLGEVHRVISDLQKSQKEPFDSRLDDVIDKMFGKKESR